MKKVFRYLQDQESAQENSAKRFSGGSYLAPPGKEPQQHKPHRTGDHKGQHHQEAHSRSEDPSSHSHSFPANVSGAGGSIVAGVEMIKHQYAQDNILQNYEFHVPEDSRPSESDQHLLKPRYWLVYIHGGYFRDPKVTSSSFHGALNQFLTNPAYSDVSQGSIAGYASINYRLSPHENYPQDPDHTSAYELRQAKWPEHIVDVHSAIAQLQHRYGFGENYILIGHSVGATMALLSILSPSKYITGMESSKTEMACAKRTDIIPPKAVIGVCGIYDFPKLHESFPGYEKMLTRNAIHNAKDDTKASPARYTKAEYQGDWVKSPVPMSMNGCNANLIVLAHSKADGLVDWRQVEAMQQVFEQSSQKTETGTKGVHFEVREIQGSHNDVWERNGGRELSKIIYDTMKMIW